MKQLELLVTLLDEAIAGIERGRAEDLLTAQFAVFGVAQAALPVHAAVDEKVVMLCEYCIERLSHGVREEEREAAQLLRQLREGVQTVLREGVRAAEVRELVNVMG